MRLIAVVTTLLWVSRALPAAANDKVAKVDLPEIRSGSMVVLDARTGAEVYGKDADDVRGIASTTKIFVAMAVRKAGIKLDDWTEITQDDVKAARGGARTRLDRGQTFQNRDLLRAMLMASDNRAPTALGRAVGLDASGLIKAMNRIAKDLGLEHTRFTDTSGLRGNVSTAREMALALRAALEDGELAAIMTTDYVQVQSKSGYAKLGYGSTNAPLLARKYKVTGGKTGFTRPAGYCFIVSAEIDGREYVMAFLGADGKHTRFADFSRVAAWIDAGAPGAKLAVKAKNKAQTSVGRTSSKKAAKLRVSAKGKVKKQ